MKNEVDKKHDVGLILSGGGVRGAAHIGVIRALEEFGITPTVVSGCSAGAIVGALYAAGYNYVQMLDFFVSNQTAFNWRSIGSDKPGLFNIVKYQGKLLEWFEDDSFESLEKDLYLAVTDVLEAKAEVFNSGSLTKAILASAALPVVFSPVEINGHWYVDGGVMDNFPLEPVAECARLTIGSYVSSVSPIRKDELRNSIKLLQRVNELGIYSASRNKFSQCGFVFHPHSLFQYGVFDTKKAKEIYELGYEFALREMDKLIPLLESEERHPHN